MIALFSLGLMVFGVVVLLPLWAVGGILDGIRSKRREAAEDGYRRGYYQAVVDFGLEDAHHARLAAEEAAAEALVAEEDARWAQA